MSTDMEAKAISVDPVLSRAVGGDPLARRALVLKHGPALWGLCRRLSQDPEDAYQAVWEKALRALPHFDPGGPAQFSTWLLSIGHRHLIDEHRRRVVRGTAVECDDVPAVAAGEAATDVARLEGAVAALPDPLRRVVVLHHLHELGLDEVAREEGVPVGTVKSRLFRARAALAVAMSARSAT